MQTLDTLNSCLNRFSIGLLCVTLFVLEEYIEILINCFLVGKLILLFRVVRNFPNILGFLLKVYDITGWISSSYVKGYNKLSKAVKVEWNNR